MSYETDIQLLPSEKVEFIFHFISKSNFQNDLKLYHYLQIWVSCKDFIFQLHFRCVTALRLIRLLRKEM